MINNFALIIGTMKGGTTSLFAYLAEHPQISPCRQKEPRFFSNDQRQWVFNELQDDLNKLNKTYGFDVSSWTV